MRYSDTRGKPTDPRFGFVLFFCFLAYEFFIQARYACLGQITQATVVQTAPYIQHQKGGPRAMLQIKYQFNDLSGATRTEIDDTPQSPGNPSAGDTIDIEYCPNWTGASRLAGYPTNLVLGFTLLLLAGEIVVVTCFFANRPVAAPDSSGLFERIAK